jgi:hypothetical protein
MRHRELPDPASHPLPKRSSFSFSQRGVKPAQSDRPWRSSYPNQASRGSIRQTSATTVRSNAPGGCQWSRAESNTTTGTTRPAIPHRTPGEIALQRELTYLEVSVSTPRKEFMDHFVVLPRRMNWVPPRGRRAAGWGRAGVPGVAVAADELEGALWGCVPPVVYACLWTGCGRKKDWDRRPLLGNPRCIFVSVRAARLSRPDGGSPLQEAMPLSLS